MFRSYFKFSCHIFDFHKKLPYIKSSINSNTNWRCNATDKRKLRHYQREIIVWSCLAIWNPLISTRVLFNLLLCHLNDPFVEWTSLVDHLNICQCIVVSNLMALFLSDFVLHSLLICKFFETWNSQHFYHVSVHNLTIICDLEMSVRPVFCSESLFIFS